MSEESPEELLRAVEEMERNKYLCSIDDYDEAQQLYLVTWQDDGGREWGFWGTRRLIEQIFEQVLLN